jgi:hypothetical protein
MRPASYRCIAMAIKIAINSPAFVDAVDSLLAIHRKQDDL